MGKESDCKPTCPCPTQQECEPVKKCTPAPCPRSSSTCPGKTPPPPPAAPIWPFVVLAGLLLAGGAAYLIANSEPSDPNKKPDKPDQKKPEQKKPEQKKPEEKKPED